jgi:hypothetical protein
MVSKAQIQFQFFSFLEEFDNALPEAPPNSVEPVERALSTYDDDFLSAEVDDFIEFDPLA